MEARLTPAQERLALKTRELVTPALAKEDVEKLLEPENIVRLEEAVTHRYASALNSEIDELTGDKLNAYILIKWLRLVYPNERRESVFSNIIAKFLSKEKLAQYSKELGLPALLIKPKVFKATETDYEDLFEDMMGALSLVGDSVFGDGAGALIVQSILVPIFEREGIDPDKVRDYIDPVSLLKMGMNVIYGPDPLYRIPEYLVTNPHDGSKTVWFGASVLRRVKVEVPNVGNEQEDASNGGRGRGGRGNDRGGGRGTSRGGSGGRGGGRGGGGGYSGSGAGGGPVRIEYKEDVVGNLEKDQNELERSKQKAKESVAKKALIVLGWTYDTIEEERRKKDIAIKEKASQSLAKMVAELRAEVLDTLHVSANARANVAVRGLPPITVSRKVDDGLLVGKFGKEVAHQLRLPVEVMFETEKSEDEGDNVVLIYTTNSEGVNVYRGEVRERPSQIANAYRRLVRTYITQLRQQLGLPPKVSAVQD